MLAPVSLPNNAGAFFYWGRQVTPDTRLLHIIAVLLVIVNNNIIQCIHKNTICRSVHSQGREQRSYAKGRKIG